MRSSWVRRLAWSMTLASLAGLIGACRDKEATGSLTFYGPMSTGVLAPGSVQPGEVLAFAFPMMKNTSDSPVTLVRFRVINVPEGAHVMKYRVLSVNDTDGQLMGSFPPSKGGRDGYDNFRDYPLPTIPAHRRSNYYAVVYISVRGPIAAHATGCEYTYRTRQSTMTQTSHCDFQLHPER